MELWFERFLEGWHNTVILGVGWLFGFVAVDLVDFA